MKSEQEKKERMLMKFQKEEEAQWVATRSQKDCDKAYRRYTTLKLKILVMALFFYSSSSVNDKTGL